MSILVISYKGENYRLIPLRYCPKYKKAVCNSDNPYDIVKTGFVDNHNNWVIEPMDKYKNVSDMSSNGVFAVWTGNEGEEGFMDINGDLIIPCMYSQVYDIFSDFFADGICGVQKNGKWGVINLKNEVIVPFDYDEIHDFTSYTDKSKDISVNKNKVFKVTLDGYEGLLDRNFLKDNEYLLEPKYTQLLINRADIIKGKNKNQFCFFRLGDLPKPFLTVKYGSADNFNVDTCLAVVKNGKRYGLIDLDGNVVLPFVYDRIKYIDTIYKYIGYQDKMSGYISEHGTPITPAVFKQINYNSNLYNSRRKLLLIDYKGDCVTKEGFIYDK